MRSGKHSYVLGAALLAALAAGCDRGEPALRVAAEEARACDVLVDVGAAPAPKVDFGPNVRGESSRHGARLGVSWIASNDRMFEPRAVTLRGTAAAKVLTSTCYDRDGRPIANPNVTIR
jgi:hypothetical protein